VLRLDECLLLLFRYRLSPESFRCTLVLHVQDYCMHYFSLVQTLWVLFCTFRTLLVLFIVYIFQSYAIFSVCLNWLF